MTLTEFLTARLNEDWERANSREATHEDSPWSGMDITFQEGRIYADGIWEMVDITERWKTWVQSLPLSDEAKRSRAEVTAKRAILALHSTPDGRDPSCSSIVYPELAEDCETLQALAHPHAYHPDFDPAWTLKEEA